MQSAFRTDIQALRGLAVAYVLLYHADLGVLAGGYLGVDIFFVISGFLITTLVKKGVEQGDFKFSTFYYRRAKRLLPAAYVTFLVTALLAPMMLNDVELNDYIGQLLGALTFTANFVLFFQSGYFDGAADLKPLLHIWSLSIEEQYYFVLPMAMLLCPRRHWVGMVAVMVATSLLFCLLLVAYKPVATFYLLPTRAWELGLGSLLAVLSVRDLERLQRPAALLFWPALCVLLLVPLFPLGLHHPGVDAVLVCVATLVVIARRHQVLRGSRFVGGLARIGDFSYSLYLAHWPVFAFLKNASVAEVGLSERLMALGLSVVLGYLLFRYVERPCREVTLPGSRKTLVQTLAVTCLLAVLPFGLSRAYEAEEDFSHIRRANDGFSAACVSDGAFEPKAECSSSDKPGILVWGDSYAMHLVTGVLATTDEGVTQATMGMCGPVLDLAPISKVFYTRHWAESCIEYNRSVLDHIKESAHIKTVILASPFRQYLISNDGRHKWQLWTTGGGGAEAVEPGQKVLLDHLGRTIETLRKMGKKVVVVGPTPSSDFNVGSCLERTAKGKLVLGAPTADCSIPYADHLRKNGAVNAFLDQLEVSADVEVIRLDEALCSKGVCMTKLGATYLYVDGGHLTYDGARVLSEKIGLGRLAREIAR